VPYPPLIHYASEAEYRSHFERVYCCGVVTTFDGIAVRFRKQDFDHCFFESSRRDGKKDAFSPLRAQRIDWIKAALEDPGSEMYVGWDNAKKRFSKNRRVVIVMGDYVVAILITGSGKGIFITAYVADTPGTPTRPSTIDMIRKGRRWE
jgi:hypothetical protein